MRIERVAPGDRTAADFAAVREALAYPTPDEEGSPDAEGLVAYVGDRPVARLTLEVVPALHGAPGPSGVVGGYEALDGEAGTALLVHAREILAERGVARILGPMNGSTWRRYRLALPPRPGESPLPPFLTEPTNPPGYPSHFLDAGFSAVAEYESRVAYRTDAPAEAPPVADDDPGPGGVTVSPLDPSGFEDVLREIHDLSLAAFDRNPYYTPIGFDEFAAAYRKVLPLLDPELVRLARGEDGRLLAFVFAFPDPLDRGRDGAPRVILKTLATAPEARGLGLGGRLTAEVHRISFGRGAPAVIHALMLETNASTRISGRHGTHLFRRYALYEWVP